MIGPAKRKLRTVANPHTVRGFTLTEAVMVIVITGILASMAAVFIRQPVDAFFDTARRAGLADAADTALRRIGRDLRAALPNSVRVSGGNALEFLHLRSGGRYREQGPGDVLDFTGADTTFEVLGPSVSVQPGDSVVVYNLGIPGATAYSGATANTDVRRVVSGAGGLLTNVAITSAARFPFASPARRFQVVDTPVSYICAGGVLRRYWSYAIAAAQPVPPVGASNALIADRLTGCNFTYAPGPTQAQALVTLSLALTDGGETINLLYQVHVNNVP